VIKLNDQKKIVFCQPPNLSFGTVSPPIGLLYLGTVTKLSGRKTVIIDATSLQRNINNTIKLILNETPNYLALTAVTITIDEAANIAKQVKIKQPGIITIIGGAHLTALPKETMEKNKSFDYGIIGEGEITIIELLDEIESNNKNYDKINGIIYRNNDQIIITQPRERIKDLDTLPLPDWSLLSNMVNTYSPPPHVADVYPSLGFNSSRGCPGKCIFCANSVFGNKLSYLSAKRLFEVISNLHTEYGIKEIWFGEDNFLMSKKRLKEFCELLIINNLQITFVCSGRVDTIKNIDELKLMKTAGCRQIWYGIESGNNEILKNLKKNTTTEEIKEVIKWTNNAGIDSCGYFILGSPGETEETLKKTLQFALELNLKAAHASYMIPFPGSELYNSFNQYGVFNINNWDMYKPSFIAFGLTQEILIKYSKLFYLKFYCRPSIIWIYIKRLKNPHNIYPIAKGFYKLIEHLIK